jgi:hypothetical protein
MNFYGINILCMNENVAYMKVLNCINVKEIKGVEEYFKSHATGRIKVVLIGSCEETE